MLFSAIFKEGDFVMIFSDFAVLFFAILFLIAGIIYIVWRKTKGNVICDENCASCPYVKTCNQRYAVHKK